MFKQLIGELGAACDFSVFSTFGDWFKNISINGVIMLIMMIFMLIGAWDKIQGNKRGYGEKFEDGINAMGPLAMSMAGVVAAAPVLSLILSPIVVPLYSLLGADPSMFATTLLACDMGGYPLAMKMASSEAIGNYAGLLLGTMMGPTIVFTIPVALGIIKEEDRSYLGAGVLAGLITIPIGCIAGGLIMMIMKSTEPVITIGEILVNQIPVIIIAGLIVAGLWFIPDKMISGFNAFGNGVTIVITALTAIAIFEYETGMWLPLFDQMVDAEKTDGVCGLESGLLCCGQIAIVLAGAYPMVEWITRTFGEALGKVGEKLGMNDVGSAGLVSTLANNIATFNILDGMNPKGKLLNVAFAVSAAFTFGDHLGFAAGNNANMITPMIVGKLVAGVTALIVANILAPKLLEKVEASIAKMKK